LPKISVNFGRFHYLTWIAMNPISQQGAPKNKDQNYWWREGLLLFMQMSGWIFVPVVFGLFLGRWLDRRFETEPWLFLGTTGLAFIISIVGMIGEARKAMNKMDTIDKREEKHNE
jgi:F0F1-type ATP synthase assembly protein I